MLCDTFFSSVAWPCLLASDLGLTFVALPQSRVVASRSKPLALNCTAIDDSGSSEGISYRWKHNSIPIEVDDKRYQLGKDGAVLTIRRILASPKNKKRTDGKYMCMATNRLGTLSSKEITVQSTSRFFFLLLFDPAGSYMWGEKLQFLSFSLLQKHLNCCGSNQCPQLEK